MSNHPSVYVIYDPFMTSIRGIFTDKTDAENARRSILHNEECVISRIPLNTCFTLIDEVLLDRDVDYLYTSTQNVD